MSVEVTTNENWARGLAASWLHGEKFRWELYSEYLAGALAPSLPWLDLGCGPSDFIAEHGNRASPAVGVDIQRHRPPPGLFVTARLEELPFPGGFAGTLSLRFVLEHIERPGRLWDECRRLLAPGGRIVIITTNRRSLSVALARLLPGRLRERIISRVFEVGREEIFPACHRWNTPGCLAAPPAGFELERIEFVEALDWTRRTVFLGQLLLAKITRPRILRKFRSNVLAVYRRTED